ncbi:MAG: glycosyltransferase family 4 protein [Kiritimatiellae bacterium]|nr:glycosyltransferase family 4 protein [Kiritimatiellia bacterium]
MSERNYDGQVRMKVAFVMQDTRGVYGAEAATVRLIRGLRARGVDARAWLLEESRLEGEGPSPLAAVLGAVGPTREFAVAGRASRDTAAALARAAAAEGVGVLHSTGYKADVHAAWARGLGGRFGLVATVHGWLFRRWAWKERFYRAVDVAALRRFDRVVALSAYYEGLLRRDGFDPLRLARIPTGLDGESVAGESEREALWADGGVPFTFGALGRLSEEKDQALLVRAAGRLARRTGAAPRSWRVLVAGEGPLRERLENLAAKEGVSDRVEFAGRMESGSFFRRVHALVQPSRIENMPMSILEAMAWGRPVVATSVGGMPELVEDGRTGALVGRGDAAGLEAVMAGLVGAPERARAWGAAGREKLEREFNEEEMLRAHEGLYRTLEP